MRTQADTELAQTRLFQICPMLRSVFFAGTIIYGVACSSALDQGTIQTGFEEFPVGTNPPFASQTWPFVDFAPAVVNSSTQAGYPPPFEGQNYLRGVGRTLLRSPNGELIQSFTAHVHLPQYLDPQLIFEVSGASVTREYGTWINVQGTFATPVDGITIATYEEGALREHFIDDIVFVTVPEPQSFWLLAFGFGAIVLGSRLKRSKTRPG